MSIVDHDSCKKKEVKQRKCLMMVELDVLLPMPYPCAVADAENDFGYAQSIMHKFAKR